MEYTRIPGIEQEVSRIGLGTWAMGGSWWGGTDREESVRTVRAALDAGVNLVDTAPIYGMGEAETMVGEALAQHGKRDQIVLATKAGLDWTGSRTRNTSKARIEKEIEDSLRRLGVEYIDLYQIHWPDATRPLTEPAEVLVRLREKGVIRAIGVSNFSPAQCDEFRTVAPIHTSQPPYNLFERGIEADVLPYCRQQGIAVLGYGVLCRGLLSGRMSAGATFTEGDMRKNLDPKFLPPRFEQYLAAVAALDTFAHERHGKRVIHLAARWVLDQGVDVALWGARRPGQLDALDQVIGWRLDDQARREIEAIVNQHVTDPVGPEFMAPPE
jgi:aryl-alcohol dehydrogenase-like predicted oxidoreductase